MIRKTLSILLALALSIGLLCSCQSVENYLIYFELNKAPDTLDPQLAYGEDEELLVKNLFEGLMRPDAEGNITYGAAESHTLSADKKTYTFRLGEQKVWQNGDPLTADDFVYAFRRALLPRTASSYANLLFNIKGAKELNAGKKAPFGVTAVDPKTIKIELITPDDGFLKTLTTAVAMPCHRDTFEKAKGQYGKTDETLLCNGSFRLRYWNKDNFSIRLNKNEAYRGNFVAEATAVMFSVGDRNGRATRIDKETLDMGFIAREEATEQSNLFTYEKTCYALVINKSSPFGNPLFREAFAKSIHRNLLRNELNVSFVESGCLLPNSVLLNGKPLKNSGSFATPPSYQPEEAHNCYVEAAKQSGRLPSTIEILYYNKSGVDSLAKLVAESFQQSLGVVVNIKSQESQEQLFAAVQQKNYQLAILPITAKSDEPADFFNLFTTTGSTQNAFGFQRNDYNKEVAKLTTNATAATTLTTARKANKILIKEGCILPLALYTEAFAYGKAFSCPNISPFGGIIDLALVRKIA